MSRKQRWDLTFTEHCSRALPSAAHVTTATIYQVDIVVSHIAKRRNGGSETFGDFPHIVHSNPGFGDQVLCGFGAWVLSIKRCWCLTFVHSLPWHLGRPAGNQCPSPAPAGLPAPPTPATKQTNKQTHLASPISPLPYPTPGTTKSTSCFHLYFIFKKNNSSFPMHVIQVNSW